MGADALETLAGRLRNAGRITVMTGAGVSAASGVPTFRGPDGLWRRHRVTDLATPEAFERNPALVWEWYAWRRAVIAGCRPNRAHEVLADWSVRRPGCRVITQNVDDLHLRAGTRDLVRLHGTLWELSCWRACGGAPARWRDESVPLAELPPTCIHCGGLARPAVVWFGEVLDAAAVGDAVAATACDVFLTIGTSAVIYPAAALLHEARRRGAFTAEINVEATPASSTVNLSVTGPAEAVLDALALQEMEARKETEGREETGINTEKRSNRGKDPS